MTLPGTRISVYPDGGAPQAGDKFVVSRGGNNFSIDGSELIPPSPVSQKYSLILGLNTVSATVPASTTYYGIPYKNQIDATPNQLTMPLAGTLKNIRFTAGAQPATGTFVITVQKNTVNTALLVTIPAGSAGGAFSNLVDQVSFSAGDTLRVTFVNNATSTSASLSAITFEFERDTVP